MDSDRAVRQRYTEAARRTAPELCCAVAYDRRHLEVLPAEILERDYGCGDPTRHLRRGETVLDLGSGSGKACYVAAQVVGPEGRVIGVDTNDEMLALAESYRQTIGDRLGYHNVSFRKGKIQQLAPVVRSSSVDVVISNCVLNLVQPQDRGRLFGEIYRVLEADGRAVISDIVCDADVPQKLREDPQLWSGCIAGAFREDLFFEAFRAAGFSRIDLIHRDREPWRIVEEIEFRSATVCAYKGETGPRRSTCCG